MQESNSILNGIKRGVNRHWSYTKDTLRVKPEYLLTISVADEIANNGFDSKNGFDLTIKLEEPTGRIVGSLWLESVGIKSYFKNRIPWFGRRGKVDIFIQSELSSESHIVELKNFNPSANEFNKELLRFKNFLEINNGINSLKSCHLAFPSTYDVSNWIAKHVKKYESLTIVITCESKMEETGEDAEDGMPMFYANLINMTKLQ